MSTNQPDKPATSPGIELDRFDNSTFDRGASRPVELLWLLVRCLIFLHPLPLPSRLKATTLRLFGAKIGAGVVIRSGVRISFPWRLSVGDHVWIGDEVTILSLDNVSIGSHVCLSQQSFLCTGSHDFRSRSFDLITRPIEIHAHCWVGARAFVAPGAIIPTKTMVKANQTVTQKTYPALDHD